MSGRVLTGAVAASLIIATAAAGCGGSSMASAAPTASGQAASVAQLPTAAQLKSALLTAKDLGPGFSASTQSPSTSAATSGSPASSGCPALDTLNSNASPSPGHLEQEVQLAYGDTGPFIDESLITEPAAELKRDDAAAHAAMASCKQLIIPLDDSTDLTLALTPIHFGDARTTAARMDGELDGTQINGYLAFERRGSVEVFYVFFQAGSGSSQAASAYYTKAVDKVVKVLGPLATDPKVTTRD